MDERAVTLYYAEDDKAIAEAVREYLAGRGCRVTVFAGSGSIKACAADPPPGCGDSGLEFAPRIC